MLAQIEFESRMKNGIIAIPKDYLAYIKTGIKKSLDVVYKAISS